MSTKKKTIGVAEIEKEFGVLTFGKLIKSYRLGEDFTQVELAKFLKVSKQNVNDLESERKIPSIKRAVLLARKIGVLEELAVQVAIQDQIRREKLQFTVTISSRKKAS